MLSLVFINGMISADTEMHGYELSITNTSNGNQQVYHKHAHEDASMYHIHDHWINDVSGHSDMVLTIKATMDHEGTEKVHTVMFHCHPM